LKNVLHVEYVAKGKDQNNLSFFFNKGKKNQEVNYVPASLSEYLDLEVDSDQKNIAIVDVEAMITMEELVDTLLPLKLVPLVVPEFKGITVGGSIQGILVKSNIKTYM